MLAGDLGRRTGRSQSYPRSSLGVPRQVLTHGAVKLTFRGGQFFGVLPLPIPYELYFLLCTQYSTQYTAHRHTAHSLRPART